jgi:hypothetical protein
VTRPVVHHPYIARLYRFWLLEQADVTALVSQRVVSDLATDAAGNAVAPEGSWVQVHNLGGNLSDPAWISTTLLQVDCVAGARYATHALAETVRSVTDSGFRGLVVGDADEAVISGLSIGGIADDSDTRFPGKPVPRSRFTVQVHSHPTLSAAS